MMQFGRRDGGDAMTLHLLSDTRSRPMESLAVRSMEPPSNWEQDLVWRMSRARPRHTVRGLNFTGALEAVRSLQGEKAVQRCLEVGGEEKFLDFFSYPAHSLLRMYSFAAELLAPTLGGGDAVLRELGRRATLDFLASPVGRAAKVLAQGNPRRMVESAPEIYRQTMGFGSLSVEWTGPRSGCVVRRGDFLPAECHEASFEQLLRSMGVRQAKVRRAWVDGLEGGLAFSWE
ncbi:DUF2378 family protein [Archangium minus]|uniref:DUF2378 family protein n=2 Tax=Archangium minus TaxID=83450 RepID=A0ABY9X8F2_9BACT|nr:DUF2378 family protein [Archangium minus]